MTLDIAARQLCQYADAIGAKAARLNDPDSIAQMRATEAQFRRLCAMVQAGISEIDALRTLPVRAPRRSKSGLNAWAFWGEHGRAVDAIRAVYGDNWKIKSPFGHTTIVEVPAMWRSAKTERGTKLTWPKDQRVPAAQYWPGGALPAELTVFDDYPRHEGPIPFVGVPEALKVWRDARDKFRKQMVSRKHMRAYERRNGQPARDPEVGHNAVLRALEDLRAARATLRSLGATPWFTLPPAHDDDWHRAHGYVWAGDKLGWLSEVWLRVQTMHLEDIEAEREHKKRVAADLEAARVFAKLEEAARTYGPQPAANDDEQVSYADAAD